MLHGLGNGTAKPIGHFTADVVVDELNTNQKFIVLPNSQIDYDGLLGDDLIKKFRLVGSKQVYTFLEGNSDEIPMNEFALIYNVTEEASFIAPPEYRKEVEQMIESSCHGSSEVVQQCPIQLKIIHDGVIKPFHHSPSRLAADEASENADKVRVISNRSRLKKIRINGVEVECLVDTGSDVSVIKESIFKKLKNVALIEDIRMLHGLGNGTAKPIGHFTADVVVDELNTNQKFIVLPNSQIDYDGLLGDDLIKKFRLVGSKQVYTFLEGNSDEIPMNEYALIYNVTEEASFIAPPEYRKEVEQMIESSYHGSSEIVKQCPIQLKIIHDGVIKTFHHSPSRLAADEASEFCCSILMAIFIQFIIGAEKSTEAESKHHSYYLEVKAAYLALKKFRHYLFGFKFDLVSDCAAFKQTTTKSDVPREVSQWILYMEDFTFKAVHRPGDKMRHVDFLSRFPLRNMVVTTELTTRIRKAQLEDNIIKAVLKILSQRPYQDFKLKGGLHYKVVKGNDLLAVPKLMERDVIQGGAFLDSKDDALNPTAILDPTS
ncbi:uncharacterized protein [Drosophila tropicalis]|uniref:uncharacterized protein n=1 Tax=Drosophila tropicalis TaxID=46794 RepID=UPI0035AB895E